MHQKRRRLVRAVARRDEEEGAGQEAEQEGDQEAGRQESEHLVSPAQPRYPNPVRTVNDRTNIYS